MRRLARINGRTDDMLIIRGVNVFPSQLEELILRSGAFSPAYLIEVEREGHLDRLTINVEWARPSRMGTPAEESAASALVHHVKSSVGISVQVRILAPGTLERSAGKARRVIDRRQQR
jgi:phenylacetate-CoA ligase